MNKFKSLEQSISSLLNYLFILVIVCGVTSVILIFKNVLYFIMAIVITLILLTLTIALEKVFNAIKEILKENHSKGE